MTKKVRIENADTSDYKVVVQIFEKNHIPDEPDILVKEIPLSHPCAMTGDDVFITSTRYLVVREI